MNLKPTGNLVFVVVALAAAGCQNEMTVQIDGVMGVTCTRLDPDSRLGQRLDARIRDLSELIEGCKKAEQKLDEWIEQFPEDWGAAVNDSTREIRAVWQQVADEGHDFREECRKYYCAPDIVGLAPEARDTIRQVDAFLERSGEKLIKWQRQAAGLASLSDMIAEAAVAKANEVSKNSQNVEMALAERERKRQELEVRFRGELELGFEEFAAAATRAATNPTRPPNIGFGGFSTTDIYEINPSDPLYQKVLGGHVGYATLSKASIKATGDSGLMMVMEHPGQVRVYQVSNNPTQVTRNIGLLVSKGTQAAARFAAPVP